MSDTKSRMARVRKGDANLDDLAWALERIGRVRTNHTKDREVGRAMSIFDALIDGAYRRSPLAPLNAKRAAVEPEVTE